MAGGDKAGDEPVFQPNRLVGDAFLTDSRFVSAPGIAEFLMDLPYDGVGPANANANAPVGRQSWLAPHAFDIERAGRDHRINPLVLLALLDAMPGPHAEGWLSRTERPITPEGYWCKCPDGSCPAERLTVESQAQCIARTLRRAFDAATTGEDSGWLTTRVGRTFRLRDGSTVVPENAATAALYHVHPYGYGSSHNSCRAGLCAVHRLLRVFIERLDQLRITRGLTPIDVAANTDEPVSTLIEGLVWENYLVVGWAGVSDVVVRINGIETITRSDADGRYTIEVPAGQTEIEVLVTKRGYLSSFSRCTVGAGDCDVEIEPSNQSVTQGYEGDYGDPCFRNANEEGTCIHTAVDTCAGELLSGYCTGTIDAMVRCCVGD